MEQRKQPRYKIYTPAEAKIFNKIIPVAVVEISIGGMRLQTTQSIPPASTIEIAINVGRKIIFYGAVSWVLGKVTKAGYEYQTGIEIETIVDNDDEIVGLKQVDLLIKKIVVLTKNR